MNVLVRQPESTSGVPDEVTKGSIETAVLLLLSHGSHFWTTSFGWNCGKWHPVGPITEWIPLVLPIDAPKISACACEPPDNRPVIARAEQHPYKAWRHPVAAFDPFAHGSSRWTLNASLWPWGKVSVRLPDSPFELQSFPR